MTALDELWRAYAEKKNMELMTLRCAPESVERNVEKMRLKILKSMHRRLYENAQSMRTMSDSYMRIANLNVAAPGDGFGQYGLNPGPACQADPVYRKLQGMLDEYTHLPPAIEQEFIKGELWDMQYRLITRSGQGKVNLHKEYTFLESASPLEIREEILSRRVPMQRIKV